MAGLKDTVNIWRMKRNEPHSGETILTELINRSFNELREKMLFTDYFPKIELEQIDEQYYLTNLEEGIGCVFDENQCLKSIHFYSENKDGANSFSGEMPKGLLFSDSVTIAHDKIGINEFDTGGGEKVPFFGMTNPWRRYHFESVSLHLEFSQKDSIVLITLSRIKRD